MGPYEFSLPNPTDLLDALKDDILDIVQHEGVTGSLGAKLDSARQKLEDDNPKNDKAAFGLLKAFINAVEAQRGKKISESQADSLVHDAQAIIGLLSKE